MKKHNVIIKDWRVSEDDNPYHYGIIIVMQGKCTCGWLSNEHTCKEHSSYVLTRKTYKACKEEGDTHMAEVKDSTF